MKIPLGIEGRILASGKAEHFVVAEDDRANTGGFLIYERWDGSKGPNAAGAFDTWVGSEGALEAFLVEAGWDIAWPS